MRGSNILAAVVCTHRALVAVRQVLKVVQSAATAFEDQTIALEEVENNLHEIKRDA
jgi:hypothetical protein